MKLWVRVLSEIGYYDIHPVGETFKMPLRDVNNLVKDGYIEIIVNNKGNNLPYDEVEETKNFEEQEVFL